MNKKKRAKKGQPYYTLCYNIGGHTSVEENIERHSKENNNHYKWGNYYLTEVDAYIADGESRYKSYCETLSRCSGNNTDSDQNEKQSTKQYSNTDIVYIVFVILFAIWGILWVLVPFF